MTKVLDLDDLVLDRGSHDSPDEGMCVMEAVAVVAGETFSDHPACASPVIGAFLRSWNDSLNDTDRQQLKRYVTLLPGTASTPEVEDARAWMALDWLVRTYTPAWLRLAKLDDQAVRLEALPEFRAGMDVPSIRPTIDAVRSDAAAARDAAGAAAGAAAWAAAGDAAWAAAGDAAGDAARDAARDAAGAAAWAAAGDAAGDAARDAAWAAARDAAWDAAGAAAGAALRPTRDELMGKAHILLDRMIGVQA
jgi:hypothetical protein